MLREAVGMLDLHDDDVVIDGTAGQGGHSEAILKSARVTLLSIDADDEAVARTSLRLSKLGSRAENASVVLGNFSDIRHLAHARHIKEANKVLLDLGWNMGQLESGRGFSFLHDEPLNMSYGERPASGFTAAEILNTWEEKAIADALFGYGEERYARRIARAVVERREIEPIETTLEFVEIIKDAVPGVYRHGKIHPATRSFQALRIAVNDELGVLERGLEGSFDLLACDGRLAVITFHSIEDRKVKQAFARWVKEGKAKLLTKKPMTADSEEIISNRPSRSAKLRGIQKICNEK
jgi:16S rRNA (cytosine1402-N4)-methyltransferase